MAVGRALMAFASFRDYLTPFSRLVPRHDDLKHVARDIAQRRAARQPTMSMSR